MAALAPTTDLPARPAATPARRHPAAALVTHLALAAGALLFCFPFLWTVATSLKTGQETQQLPPTFLPEVPQWLNYAHVWTTQPVARWLGNSALVVVAAVPGAVLTSLLVAYAFARYRFPGRDALFLVVLSTLMLPEEVVLIPQYIIYQQYFGWIDTFWPLIVPAWAGGGALSIFLMRQFLLAIPRELDEAARIDGANALQILLLVLTPLCRPALATVAILQFLKHWNDFLGPFIFLSSPERFTMSLGLRFFQTIPETVGAPKEHLLMAATVIMALPAVALFFAAQRHFVRGIVMSGIKG
jgi:multiple sugar transport system permease protein